MEVLGFERSGRSIDGSNRLFRSPPEFNSMAVVAILTASEDEFGIAVDDDEVDAELFESIDSLTAFVDAELTA